MVVGAQTQHLRFFFQNSSKIKTRQKEKLKIWQKLKIKYQTKGTWASGHIVHTRNISWQVISLSKEMMIHVQAG